MSGPHLHEMRWEISAVFFFFFLHTLIDLTPVFSYVSLTFARKWLILAVWDLIRLGAVYKLNCSLRLTGCLFTVFTPDMHYDLGCVCVCVCVHKWVSIDIMSAPDGYSEHFFFFPKWAPHSLPRPHATSDFKLHSITGERKPFLTLHRKQEVI